MTSLSNIFKSLHSPKAETPTRSIAIRRLDFDSKHVEVEDDPETSFVEREKEIESKYLALEQEKQTISKLKETTMAEIAQAKNDWEEEKVQLQQQAYEEAFQVGFSEGREKAYGEMKTSIEQANHATEQSYINAQQYQMSQERVVLEVAMKAAERILGSVLADDQEQFLGIVRRALKEVQEMKEIKLYVSLENYQLVSNHRGELAAIFPPDIPFLVFVNEDFEATECYIETNHGRVVVSVDEQLSHLREQLIEIMESRD